MAKYRLTVVDDEGHQIGEIGEFSSEQELRRWAEENKNSLQDWETK